MLILIVAGMSLGACARGRGDYDRDSIEGRFDRGIAHFEKKRWSRAGEDFKWVVTNNPASSIAAEAQYSYAECLFKQKLYIEAQVEFERLIRQWASSEHLVEARYRIVECLVAQSPDFYFDQKSTRAAIEELQGFVDDFPASPQRKEAEERIRELREKIANKYYESGRLYLKWRRSQSARLYLENILSQYYDTSYADKARVGIVVSYILEEDLENARRYLEENTNKFNDERLVTEATDYIEMAANGKFKFSFYIKLYR
ncbi:outer membrane protein assembly factor BamD [Candidatus Neomarinimicrobiota bacterium]